MLGRIVADPDTTLFIARDDDRVVGMLTLVAFEIPTGLRALIEDVVVDDAVRGSGAGSALVAAALAYAAARWAPARWTSLRVPDREAANRLYLRMGFETRATNVYRKTLDR